jgi:alanine-alpha-ketoisovalerate/valine-pyruvate aminotransferase
MKFLEKTREAICQSLESRRLLNELFSVVLTKDRVKALACVATIAGLGAGQRVAVEFVRRGVLAGLSFQVIERMYTSAASISKVTGDDPLYVQEQLENLSRTSRGLFDS